MKDYHEYKKVYIGDSDIATLILAGAGDDGVKAIPLHFEEDADYQAYVVDEQAAIGDHYQLKAEFESWMKVYDDHSFVREFVARKIKVYRTGMRGCIIQLLNQYEGGNQNEIVCSKSYVLQ